MCLSHTPNTHPSGEALVAGTAKNGQPLRLIVEIQDSPFRVRAYDPVSGEKIIDLDAATSKQLLGDDNGPSNPARSALSQLVSAMAQPRPLLETVPTGLPSNAMEQRIAASARTARRTTRRKLWDLAYKLHCPVIGTCLDTDELRAIARKAAAECPDDLTEYDVHVGFVAAAGEKNSLSLATHKALDKKYARHIKRFGRAKTAEQLTGLWEAALACGEVPAALWASLTHTLCNNDLNARIFGELHMLSHQVGAGQRADLQRLTEAEAELVHLQRDFDSSQRRQRRQLEDREQRLHELQKTFEHTDRQRRELVESASQLSRKLSELQAHENQGYVDRLVADLAERDNQLTTAQRQLKAKNTTLAVTEQTAEALRKDKAELTAECAAMERFITQSLNVCDGCEQRAYEESPDLGGRRILCVGGRIRSIEQYRELVTRCNGRFEHYDGGLEDNRQRLDALLLSADAVVCATDSVSHDAYYRLKRYCKRNEKPHVFLRSSGISSFTRAVVGMAG